MKPIPPGYCEAADNAPIPGRPWWDGAGGSWTRRDGARVVSPTVDRIFGRTKHAKVYVVASENDPTCADACEACDDAHPLPHPGYRAGQVWLVPTPDGKHGTLTISATNKDGEPAFGDVYVDGAGILSRAGAFLLSDPLMPSRAPWSPT